MATTLAFDVYGTLFDTNGVTAALAKLVGDQAGEFAKSWRDKQLEYSFRRGLMRDYVDLGVCTRQALDFVCRSSGVEISENGKKELMETYRTLPVFNDVKEGLESLAVDGFRMYAFSNGRAQMVAGLLKNSGIENYFLDVVSVDEIGSFKPDPEVYKHFLGKTGSLADDSWLVSGNPFDVLGAMAAGMNGLWLQRTPEAVFDPWGVEPSATAKALSELAGKIRHHKKG